jgi:hypothetical protein
MRRAPFNTIVCSLLAAALLIATSQYLAHFHIPQSHAAFAQAVDAHGDPDAGHGAQEHCSLCLQFDRLPAPPATGIAAVAYFFLVATVEAQRLERIALDAPLLWPPSRGPPSLA